MPTEAERAEIIRQLLKLLDEIDAETDSNLIRAKVSIARGLVRKLAAPRKGDGEPN